MLDVLRKEVCAANHELVRHNLVTLTWGNASGIDLERRLMVIKPSGVPYDQLEPSQMVDRRSGGPRRRGPAPAVERHSHPPHPLPQFPADRRHRPHAQPPAPRCLPRPGGRFPVWARPTPTISTVPCP